MRPLGKSLNEGLPFFEISGYLKDLYGRISINIIKWIILEVAYSTSIMDEGHRKWVILVVSWLQQVFVVFKRKVTESSYPWTQENMSKKRLPAGTSNHSLRGQTWRSIFHCEGSLDFFKCSLATVICHETEPRSVFNRSPLEIPKHQR